MWWISHSKLDPVILNHWSIIAGTLFPGAYILKIKCRSWLAAGLTLEELIEPPVAVQVIWTLLTSFGSWIISWFLDRHSINAWLLNHFRFLIKSCFLNQRLAPRSLFWFPSQIRVYNIITIDGSQVCTSIIAMLRERAPRRSLLK